MNIFYVDSHPGKAAQALCNKHVIKMVLESAQLLCTAHHLHPSKDFPEKFYKPTHKNHPASKWIRKVMGNYFWLCQHAYALCEEYTYRYDKVHASQSIIEWCYYNSPNIKLGPCDNSPALAMPDEYKLDDPVAAYRKYYVEDKMKNIDCRWTKRNKPEWINE